MEKDLVSIIVPVYNVAKYIGYLFDSIKGQTYDKWELLLIDDSSDDGSDALCEEFSNQDERVYFYRRQGALKGAPVCRNQGLQMAKGKYVIYLDSDDVIAPYCLRQRVDYMHHNDCDFAVFPLVGYHTQLFDDPNMVWGYKPQGDIMGRFINRTLPFVVVSNIYKRDALLKNNLYWDTELKSYQDSDYNISALLSGLNYSISNLLPDYFYRLGNENSICKKLVTETNCISQIKFLKKQKARVSSEKKYRDDLSICACQILRNSLQAQSSKAINDLIDSGVFNNVLLSHSRIKILLVMAKIFNSYNSINLLMFLILPITYLRFTRCYRKYAIETMYNSKELKNMFYEKNENQVIEKIKFLL